MIANNNLFNLRDLGGLPTVSGMKVRHDRLIRSGSLWGMPVAQLKNLESVRAAFDLRSENERKYHPAPVLPNAKHYAMAVTERGRREFVNGKRGIEDKVRDILAGYYRGEPAAVVRMTDVYRRMLLSEEMSLCLSVIIRVLAQNTQGAVLWHCAVGKDRTGVVTAVLLRLLGVPDKLIYQDYLYSNQALALEIAQAEAFALEITDDPAASAYVKNFFIVCPCWLSVALHSIDSNFSSADDFILSRTSITGEELRSYRENCLDKK